MLRADLKDGRPLSTSHEDHQLGILPPTRHPRVGECSDSEDVGKW